MRIKHRSNYIERRKEAYPSIEAQLDILYHEGFDAWKDIIQAIKEANPKPPSE